jgi:hypothetical protein
MSMVDEGLMMTDYNKIEAFAAKFESLFEQVEMLVRDADIVTLLYLEYWELGYSMGHTGTELLTKELRRRGVEPLKGPTEWEEFAEKHGFDY